MKYTDYLGNELSAHAIRIDGQPSVRICVNGEAVTVAQDDVELVTGSLAKVATQEPKPLDVFANANVIAASIGDQNVAAAVKGVHYWHVYVGGRLAYDVEGDIAARTAVDLICHQEGYLSADAEAVSVWREIVRTAIVGQR